MTTPKITIVEVTDTEPACHTCGEPVSGSVSVDFCSETCQTVWHAKRSALVAPIAGPEVVPDTELPEAPPVRPLTWLDPTSAVLAPQPGHDVLDDVATFVGRFSAFPSEHCAPTLALWYAHTHIAGRLYVTPRLILDSAEPGSGKTRVLEVAQYLVAAPEMTISATTAALFRLVSEGPVTILFDEVDAIFNPKTGGNNEDLRGMLNAGYKRSATIARCVGDAKAMKVQRFPVYAPAALAGIAGGMPATITTRAITIHMRRRRADERVEPFRERLVARQAKPIREALTAWITSVADQVADAEPDMPEGVTDRSAEIWEPLIAIADAAGGHWPYVARNACRHFVLEGGPQVTSLGVRLLADLRDVFAAARADRMTTAEILTALLEMDDGPWSDLYGKPLDARRLAKELARYGVTSKNLKLPGGLVAKGYRTDGQDGLADAWARYLPADATAATSATADVGPVADTGPVADEAATQSTHIQPEVAGPAATSGPAATRLTRSVADVAPVAHPIRRAS